MTDKHVVAVVGGAVAGAEMARTLAARGAEVVVFEQNRRPFGKIEDGLPRWHSGLRDQEYKKIVDRLAQPRVHFVPLTKIGRDWDFVDLTERFSAVVLACGAWRDRRLPVPGASELEGHGLVYQNPFIVAFNHMTDPGYDGPPFEMKDGALVVGGGLASIDVAKVLMLEATRQALASRGIEVDLEEMEKAGIPKTLALHGIDAGDLGIRGCTLIYRRRAEDMPLLEMPKGADEARQTKVKNARKRALDKAISKFGFRFEPLARPDQAIVEDGRLVGLELRRMSMETGKLTATDEVFELRGSMVISSIGSVPDPIPGIEMQGELFAFEDWDMGRMTRFPNVFSAGNVVTGKGNIVASRKHSLGVAERLVESFLGLADDGHTDEGGLVDGLEEVAETQAETLAESIAVLPGLPVETRNETLRRVEERQRAVGYPGDIHQWTGLKRS